MKGFFKNTKFVGFLHGVISFILCLCIVGFSITMLIRFTVLNGQFLSDTLNNSEYYEDLCDEITGNLKDIGDASGLDKEFFESFVDEVLVRQDVQEYIDNFYGGKKLEVNTDNFENSLREALDEYQAENNITSVSEKNINYFIDESAKIYVNNIKITYFSVIQGIVLKLTPVVTAVGVVLGIIALGLVCVLFFANKWKHIGIRHIYYGFAGAGLVMLIVPVAVFAGGFIGKIAILSRSLNVLYSSCFYSMFNDMLIIAVVLLVISAVLWIIHSHIRNKAMVEEISL